jgi:hypothetical protein
LLGRADALDFVSRDQAQSALTRLLADGDPRVTLLATLALAELGDAAAGARLKSFVES